MDEQLFVPGPGTYIKTARGVAMIEAVNHQHMRYTCVIETEHGPKTFFVDMETVLPSEYVGDLREPENAEKYLNGEGFGTGYETVEAFDIPCDGIDGCNCTWCYKVSSNGFHMTNQGQCSCWKNECPCVHSVLR